MWHPFQGDLPRSHYTGFKAESNALAAALARAIEAAADPQPPTKPGNRHLQLGVATPTAPEHAGDNKPAYVTTTVLRLSGAECSAEDPLLARPPAAIHSWESHLLVEGSRASQGRAGRAAPRTTHEWYRRAVRAGSGVGRRKRVKTSGCPGAGAGRC